MKITLAIVDGYVQSVEGLSRTEKQSVVEFALLELGRPPSPALGHQRSWFLDLWPHTGTHTIVSPWFSVNSPGSLAIRVGLALYH